MKRHISILAILFSAFAAVGLTGTAEAGTLRTYYKTPTGAFGGPDESVVSPITASTPMQSIGKDFTATCPTGQKIEGWYYYSKSPTSGGTPTSQAGTGNPVHLVITDSADCWLCAHLAWITYKVNYDANGGSGGPSNATGSYNSNFTVSSTTPSKSGYDFAGWKADTNGETYSSGASVAGSELCRSDWHDDNQTVTMTAQWTISQYTISTAVEPAGAGSVAGGGTYDFGTQASLKATANAGWEFEKWKDGGTDNPRTVTVGAAAATYTAVFRQLTVAKPYVTKSFTYDGTAKTCATAGDHYTVTGNTGTAVGDYTFTAKLKDGYAWSDGSTADYTESWKITAATITGVTLKSTSVTYDGQSHQPSVASVVANGKTFSTSATGWTVTYLRNSVETSDFKNAGTIAVRVTGTSNLTGSYTAYFTVGTKEIRMDEVVFADLTETYDGTEKTVKASNVPSGVTVTYSSNARTTVGEQQARVTFEPNDKNHTVSLAQKFATLKIEQATITAVALNGTSATYDGQSHKPTIGWVTANNKTFSNSYTGWDVTYLRNGAATGDFTSPGTITVTATGNSNLKGTASATFTINKATIESVTLVTGSATYDGKPHQPQVASVTASGEEFSSASAGWTVAYTRGGTATTDFTKAGAITVTVTGKTGLSGTASATFTIGKKTISTTGVSFSDKSVTYDGTAKSITASSVPEGVAVTYSNNSRTDAGSQTATANFTPTDKENCTVSPTSKSATLTITPAAISAIALNATSATYDGQPHQPQVVSVTANGKTFADAAIGWNVAYDKTDFTSVGNIKVTATGKNNLTGSASATFEIKSKSITVTFDPNGGNAPSPASKTVQYPGTYGTLATCTRKGYDLKGWWTAKEGGTEITSATSVESTANQTLFAHWEAKKYNVTIDPKGGLFNKSTKPTTFEEALTFDATNMNILAVSVKEDGTPFLGYYTSGGIQVYNDEGKCVLGKTYWDGDWPDGKYVNDGNLTVEARWSDAPRYDVSVEADPAAAGTATGGGTFEAGTSVTLTATPSNGYSFAYWRREVSSIVSTDNPYEFTASSAAAGTYTAVFTGNVYKVTFRESRQSPAPVKYVTFGEPYGELPKFTTPTEEVEGWYTDFDGEGERISETTRVTTAKDHNLYANWGPLTHFDVNWVDPSGKNDTVPQSKVSGEIRQPPAKTENWPDQRGNSYWIKGWNPPLPVTLTSNTTITAVWESYSDVLDCSNLTFNVRKGWVVETNKDFCAEGNSCLKITSLAESGNTVSALNLTEGGEFTFQWKAGAQNAELSVLIGTGGTKTNFTYVSYPKWQTETIKVVAASTEQSVEISFREAKDLLKEFCALDAMTWTPGGVPSKREITVQTGEHGSVTGGGAFDVGANVTLTATADTGYAFCCWTNDTGFATNDNPWTFKVVDDATYTATFTACVYRVTLNPSGGQGGQTEVLATFGDVMPELESLPQLEHNTFLGYFDAATGGKKYYSADGTSAATWDKTADAELFAQWKEDGKAVLTVISADETRGTVAKDPDESSYYAGTPVTISATAKTGYAFQKWSDESTEAIREITVVTDATYTATFTARVYRVTFDANGGTTPTPAKKDVAFGELYGNLATTTKSGYEFAGWWTAASGGKQVTAGTAYVTADNQTLYAHWSEDVGELSKILDCNNLKFVEDVAGWNKYTEDFKKGDSCLRTAAKNAKISAKITTGGTLTFWWRGKATSKYIAKLDIKAGTQSKTLSLTKTQGESDWTQEKIEGITVGEGLDRIEFACSMECEYLAIDFVTWAPEGGGEPTPGEAVAPTAAGVANGVFSLTIPAESGTDYGVWTNADLTVDSWGLMGEPQKGEGKPMEFRWTILPGFPQLFFRAHKVEYR